MTDKPTEVTTTDTPYYKRVVGGKLSDQLGDRQMQKDMVEFFKSSRYGYTKEDFQKMGPQGVYDAFAEHMRYQENNSWTATRDIFFVNDKVGTTDAQRASFGRLMQAWDNSEGEDMSLTKVWDYVAANITDPINIGTIATAGVGSAAKVAAQGGGIAARMAIRKATAAALAKEGLRDSFIKGAATGAVANATATAGMDVLNQQARISSIEGREYSPGQTAASALGGAVMGGAIGGVSRAVTARSAKKVTNLLDQNEAVRATNVAAGNKQATKKLKTTRVEIAQDIVKKLDVLLESESKSRRAKNPIPKDTVARGELIQKIIGGDSTVEDITIGRLTVGSIRRTAAAMSDIADEINFDPTGKKSITEAMTDALNDPQSKFTSEVYTKLLDTYGITRSDFSALIAAEISQAGKTLQTQSAFAKSMSRSTRKAMIAGRNKNIDAITESVMGLAKKGIITQNADQIQELSKQAKLQDNAVYKFLQAADASRIGFMTSQLATTSANFTGGVFRIGVDFVDRFFENVLNLRNPMSGTFDMLKGLSYGADEAEVLYQLGARDIPDKMQNLLNNATRFESGLDEVGAAKTGMVSGALNTVGSGLSKVSRIVNVLNSVSDNTFKNAQFYASVSRQLKDLDDPKLGKNFLEFVKNKGSLEALPESLVAKAVDDALRFTYQRTYLGEETAFAKGARALIEGQRKLPFVISSFQPFPKFAANQIEFIHDYTPLLGMAGMLRSAAGNAVENKSWQERVSRQFTGSALLASAYAWRYQQGPETAATEYVDPKTGQVKELSRLGGPMNFFLVLADAMVRYNKAGEGEDVYLPRTSMVAADLYDAAVGSAIIPDKTAMKELVSSFENGKATDGLKRVMDDVIATYTYPVSVFNDIYGQVDPRVAAKPFTKSVTGQGFGKDVVDEPLFTLFGLIEVTSTDYLRATRFLPDTPFLKIAQSDPEGYELPLMSPFANGLVREVDPALKQLTAMRTSPARSELQKEMRRMDIEEFEAFKATGPRANANIEYAVRWYMSNKKDSGGIDTPARFIEWKKNNDTYEAAKPDQKRLMLLKFLSDEVSNATTAATETFNSLANENPKAAAGYIRNMYAIKVKAVERSLAEDTVKGFTGVSIDEYIHAAQTVEDELNRKIEIMNWIGRIVK